MAAVDRLDLSSGRLARAQASVPSIALGAKRVVDLCLGITAGVLIVPVLLAIGAAIRLDSPGPALFRARRIGRNGRHFTMYKFRTMVDGAEHKLDELAHLNRATGMVKIPDDPRVTRIGMWLRRFSLDELPQVINIVAGDMSLVGPRPHDVTELDPDQVRVDPRFTMRPGLTGLWQVSARTDPDFAKRVHFDSRYVTDWSLLLDLKILAKTVPSILHGQGGATQGPEAATTND
jgi:lipopolysaccharide/colanic/teichoic acid biosynthesis glycosyltransferase